MPPVGEREYREVIVKSGSVARLTQARISAVLAGLKRPDLAESSSGIRFLGDALEETTFGKVLFDLKRQLSVIGAGADTIILNGANYIGFEGIGEIRLLQENPKGPTEYSRKKQAFVAAQLGTIQIVEADPSQLALGTAIAFCLPEIFIFDATANKSQLVLLRQGKDLHLFELHCALSTDTRRMPIINLSQVPDIQLEYVRRSYLEKLFIVEIPESRESR